MEPEDHAPLWTGRARGRFLWRACGAGSKVAAGWAVHARRGAAAVARGVPFLLAGVGYTASRTAHARGGRELRSQKPWLDRGDEHGMVAVWRAGSSTPFCQ
jgi:hypothetical protein